MPSRGPEIHDGSVSLGRNWEPVVARGDQVFRWVDTEAEVRLAGSPATNRRLLLDVAPGPSYGKLPAELYVLDNSGRQIASFALTARQTIAFDLPETGDGKYLLCLDGDRRAVPNDHRILNLQVFDVRATDTANIGASEIIRTAAVDAPPERAPADNAAIVGPDIHDETVQLHRNWERVVVRDGECFRWVETNAVFSVVGAVPGETTLELDVEPGPSCGPLPARLYVLDAADREVAALMISERESMSVKLPVTSGLPARFRLCLDGAGRRIPNDPRILNFRVFRMQCVAEEARTTPPEAAPAASDSAQIATEPAALSR